MNILILIIVSVFGVWLGRRLALARMEMKYGEGGAGGLAEVNKQRQEQKEEAKRKIVEYIRQNGRITNDEVEKITGVSDTSAFRYLEELESEGKIVQKGENRGIFYELK